MNKNSSEIQKALATLLQTQGIEIFAAGSVAAIKKDFLLAQKMDLEGIDYALVLAYPLVSQVLEEIVDRPTLLYKHLYRQVNNLLDRIALQCAVLLQQSGAKAIPIPASQMVDWEKNLGHLSHRQVAVELGLGYYGRNNLLVTPQCGAQVRLVTILTSLPLDIPGPGKNQERDCGPCKACVKACPVKAIHTGPQDFDRAACFAQTKEFEKIRGISTRICGICVRACKPGTRK